MNTLLISSNTICDLFTKGNYGYKLEASSLPSNISTTNEYIPLYDGCNYFFLPWSDTKPCIQIASFFEDVSYRLEAINQIKNLKNFIVKLDFLIILELQ